jgi:hypothetical protein
VIDREVLRLIQERDAQRRGEAPSAPPTAERDALLATVAEGFGFAPRPDQGAAKAPSDAPQVVGQGSTPSGPLPGAAKGKAEVEQAMAAERAEWRRQLGEIALRLAALEAKGG